MADAACEAVREALSADLSGELALEAVQLVADLIRTRKCSCPPQVYLPPAAEWLGFRASRHFVLKEWGAAKSVGV